jgi:hypothetical protein
MLLRVQMGNTMDHFRATTDGDGLAKRDRKNSLDSTEQKSDQSDKGQQEVGDPWAKVSAYSCTTGSAASSDSCKPEKLPHVEIVNHDPGAQASKANDSGQPAIANANSSQNGESVLKRLAVAAGPSGHSETLETKPLTSGFQSVAQVSLVSKRTEQAQIVELPQTIETAGANRSIVPTVRASDLVVKESTPGVKIEPVAVATTTIPAVVKESPTSNQVIKETATAPASSKIETANGQSGFQSASQVALRAETSSALISQPGSQSGFQSVAQVSLRPDAVVDKAGKTISNESVVIAPITPIVPLTVTQYASSSQRTEQSQRVELPQTIDTTSANKYVVPTVRASDLVVKESTPSGRVEPTVLASTPIPAVFKESTTSNQAIKETATAPANNKIETASGQSGFQSVGQVALRTETSSALISQPGSLSGFQSVAQVSLRPDAVVDKAGKTVSNESLIIAQITPIVPITATQYVSSSQRTEQSQRVEQPQTIDTTSTNKYVVPTVRASDLVVKESTPANSKVETASGQSGFQSVAQVSLRPDAVVDKGGKTISNESLVIAPITPIVPITATQYASSSQRTEQPQRADQPQTIDTSTNKYVVPTVRASDLVVKESTPGGRVEPTVLASNSTLVAPVKDQSTATATVKDASIAKAEPAITQPGSQSAFQSVAQVSLRPDAVVDKGGKTVSNESLVIAPITPIVSFTSTQYASSSQRVEQPQTIDTTGANKSVVPTVRASDLVVKESTPGGRVEPTVLQSNTASVAPAKDLSTAAATVKDVSVAKAEPAIPQPGSQSGFQSVAQVSLRPDAVVDKAGKTISNESLVIAPITPIVPFTSTQYTSSAQRTEQPQTIDTTGANKSVVPTVRASDLVVKESTPSGRVEPTVLASNTTLVAPAKDLSTAIANVKDVSVAKAESVIPQPAIAQTGSQSGFQSVAQVSLKPDAVVDKAGKTVSNESLVSAPIAAGTRENSKIEQSPVRLLDVMQAAANSTAPKVLGAEQHTINMANQPTTALSVALAAAINGRMTGKTEVATTPGTTSDGTALVNRAEPAIRVPFIKETSKETGKETTKETISSKIGENSQISSKLHPVAQGAGVTTEAGASSSAKGNIIGGKAEAIAGAKSEAISPTKAESHTVSAEIKLPINTKGKKQDGESADDESIVATTNAKIFGGSGLGSGSSIGAGLGTNNTQANGQLIDPTVAGMIAGGTTPKPFDLPPLEITDKENETGRASKTSSSSNAGNKANAGPSQKEVSDALQALIEKRRKERVRKPAGNAGKKTPVYKPEKQRRCLVLKGDTLDSLAEQYLADSDLAELIYEINKGFWREKRHNGIVYLEVIPGSTIFLPTEEEITLFRRQRAATGKPKLHIKCAPPKAVRSLRQSLKQTQQAIAQEHTTLPPTVFTASAPLASDNSIEKTLALQLISHLAQVAESSRVLVPNQAKQVRELEDSSRVTVIGEQSEVDETAYVARIEVLCDNVWQPVMEYVIDGARGDATLKIYSRCGKVREIDLDLPLNIIRDMAFNDLATNRINYCKKYLLGRKIFC